MDARLENRYEALVQAHMQANHELAGGVKSKLSGDTAFSQTQVA